MHHSHLYEYIQTPFTFSDVLEREVLTGHWVLNKGGKVTGLEAHRLYYGQFSIPAIRGTAMRVFPLPKAKAHMEAVGNGNFNSLDRAGAPRPEEWYRWHDYVQGLVGRAYTSTNYRMKTKTWYVVSSLSDSVCILKCALEAEVLGRTYEMCVADAAAMIERIKQEQQHAH